MNLPVLAFASLLVLAPQSVSAEPHLGAEKRATVLVETDPATFVFAGHSAHIRRSLASLPGLVVGAGLYGMRLPSVMTELHGANADKGWTARIDNGYGLFADYHPSKRAEGMFVGLQLALQNSSVSRTGTAETRSFHTGLAMARVGTLYKPFDSGFYLLPWAGVGVSTAIGGSPEALLGDSYEVPPITAFATLHVGWEF